MKVPLAETAFQSLSPEEQDRVSRDLYGQEEPGIEESPTFIKHKLVALDKEISLLDEDTRKHYTSAIRMERQEQCCSDDDDSNKQYVTSAKFHLMFLSAESFDAHKAARRITRYFKEKYELFGAEKLARKIRQEDLCSNHQDKKALLSGGVSYTNATDEAGRSIIMFRREQFFQENMMSLSRVIFYVIQTMMEENEMAQQRGIIIVAYNMGAPIVARPSADARMIFPMMRMAWYGLPFRVAGIHFFYNDISEHIFINFLLVVCPQYMRARLCCHYQQTHLECKLKLMEYGINPDTGVSLTDKGKFDHEMLWNYLEQQRRLEEKSKNDRVWLAERRFSW